MNVITAVVIFNRTHFDKFVKGRWILNAFKEIEMPSKTCLWKFME